jgi:hypothetical protein
MIFPCENDDLTPMDFVPKQSNVACVIQCGGIWIGGKGWGLTWKLIQCVVKPHEVVSVYGKCHIRLSSEDAEIIENQEPDIDDFDDIKGKPLVAPVNSDVVATTSQPLHPTVVEDSDNELEIPPTPPALQRTESYIECDAIVEKPTTIPKKIVKKVAATPTAAVDVPPVPNDDEPTTIVAEEPKVLVKKKVVKKI